MKKIGTPTAVRPSPSSPYAGGHQPSSPIVGGLASAFSVSTLTSASSTVQLGRRLSLYREKPAHCDDTPLGFTELEQLVASRFPLLKLMEEASMHSLKEDEIMRHYDSLSATSLPFHRNEAAMGVDIERERLNDAFSHHMCRLLFCDNVDDIRFFVSSEVSLFR